MIDEQIIPVLELALKLDSLNIRWEIITFRKNRTRV